MGKGILINYCSHVRFKLEWMPELYSFLRDTKYLWTPLQHILQEHYRAYEIHHRPYSLHFDSVQQFLLEPS